ncbi:MAG: hypothetical protein WBX25_00690 [Rhodomicrobium sp.]
MRNWLRCINQDAVKVEAPPTREPVKVEMAERIAVSIYTDYLTLLAYSSPYEGQCGG